LLLKDNQIVDYEMYIIKTLVNEFYKPLIPINYEVQRISINTSETNSANLVASQWSDAIIGDQEDFDELFEIS
jgi:hypothetical protein